MSTIFRVKRSDPYHAFSAVSQNGAYMMFANAYGVTADLNGHSVSTYNIFARHIGLVKFIKDGLSKIKPVIEMRQSRSRLIKTTDKNLEMYTRSITNSEKYVMASAKHIYELYLAISGHNFLHGGMSIDRSFEKAYEIIKPFAETYLNHQMHMFGLAASIEVSETMEIEASVMGSADEGGDNGGGVGALLDDGDDDGYASPEEALGDVVGAAVGDALGAA